MAFEKRTLALLARDDIRDDIISGRMSPGERITENRLASDKGLSMGTIRVALDRLEREGLVNRVAYSGWNVIEISAQDAWEIFTLRAALEGVGARLACETGSPGQLQLIADAFAELRRLCSRQRKLDSATLAAVSNADFSLHAAIIAAAGHHRLAQQYAIIEDQVRLYIKHSDALLTDTENLLEQHEPLVNAIIARDGDKAERIARNHNHHEGRLLASAIREREENNLRL